MEFMRKVVKRVVSLFIVSIILVGYCLESKPTQVNAASKYVTRSQAIKMVLDELNETYDKSSTTDYIVSAKRVGLINDKTFTNYDTYINKAEIAMLLVRADEHIYGKTIEKELVNEIIDCRISDITKIRKGYRSYLAKAFALGYIKGNSNGKYSTDRKFNPKYKITLTYAKQLVDLIQNKQNRHQISPDGQLIRTTKLPKMSEFYPYILASYPNSYYDWQFLFMKSHIGDTPIYGTDRWISKRDYASPKDFCKIREGEKYFYYYYNRKMVSAKELYEECIDEWEENARNYLECVFNINYTTLKTDKAWLEKLLSADIYGVNDRDNTIRTIGSYIDAAIKNQTIVESKVIAVDKSSLYFSNEFIYLRAYIKYRVVSSNKLECMEESPIIFTRFIYPEFKNLKLGEWRECYVNIEVSSCVPNYGVASLCLDDYLYDTRMVTE